MAVRVRPHLCMGQPQPLIVACPAGLLSCRQSNVYAPQRLSCLLVVLQTVKRVSLELGGNAPFIVFNDADLELAAAGVVLSALRNSGQTCICANRVFVQDQVC